MISATVLTLTRGTPGPDNMESLRWHAPDNLSVPATVIEGVVGPFTSTDSLQALLTLSTAVRHFELTPLPTREADWQRSAMEQLNVRELKSQ